MTPLTNPLTAVGYIRVSTREQADSGLGMEAQEASIRAYCEANGIELVSVHTDAGVSGRADLDQRLGLASALADVIAHRAGTMVVAKLDRVARDPYLLLSVERIAGRSGCRLVSSAGEGTEGDEPGQILMRRILGAVAENEALLVSVRTKAALAAKKARGERVGRPPKGFSVVEGKLVSNDDWADVLRALHLRAERATIKAVAAELGWKMTPTYSILRRWKTPEAFVAFTEAQ